MIELKWKVDPIPTGQYRSFEKRGWPTACFKGTDIPACYILCEKEYRPGDIKIADHPELTILVALHDEKSFRWAKLKARAKTLAEAKEIALKFWNSENSKGYLPR